MNINNTFCVIKVVSTPKTKVKNGVLTTYFLGLSKSRNKEDCYINFISYNSLAKICSFLGKGDCVYISGHYRNYIKRNGQYSHQNFIEVSSIDRFYKSGSRLEEPIKEAKLVGDINNVLISGVIVTDVGMKPHAKHPKAMFKIVTNEKYNFERKDVKVFSNIVVNGNASRNATAWLKKGDHVYITGSLSNYKRGVEKTNNTYVNCNFFKRIYSDNIYKVHREKKVILTDDDLVNIVD